jgi:hypothetical protein
MKAAEVANIPLLLPNKAIWDAATLPLRCNGTTYLLDEIGRGLTPVARALVVTLRVAINATFGKPTNTNTTALASSLLFDGLAHVSHGLSSEIFCYCSTVAYVTDAITLALLDPHPRCVLSNILALAAEVISQVMRAIFRIWTWIVEAFSWIFQEAFGVAPGQESLAWPPFNATILLPDITDAVGMWNAMFCCLGDFVDDVLDSALITIADAINITSNINIEGYTLGPNFDLQGWHVGGLSRGLAPVFSETTLITWKTVLGLASSTSTSDVLNVLNGMDFDRLFDSYEAMCIEVSGSFADWFPQSEMGLSGLANNTAVQSLFELYLFLSQIESPQSVMAVFPQTINTTCRSWVYLLRNIIQLIKDHPDYETYSKGGYFNCSLGLLNLVPAAFASNVNNLFDMIPNWRTCKIVFKDHDIIPSLSCTGSMFDQNVGILASVPIGIYSAFANYFITVTENAHSFEEVRHVSPDPMFDWLNTGVTALAGIVKGLLDTALPLDMLEFTFPETNITIRLDKVIGTADIPPIIEGAGMMYVELGRLIVNSIRNGDFSSWKFDPADLQSFIYTQYVFANRTSKLLTDIGCFFKNAAAEAGLPDACPYSPGGNFCPLNLLPCDDGTLSALMRAIYRILDIIPEVILDPVGFGNYQLLDPAIAELENAAAQFDDAFSGIDNVYVDITKWWGTNATINPGGGLGAAVFAIVKTITATNRLLIEAIHSIANDGAIVTDSHCTSTPDTPVFYSGHCYSCSDPIVQAAALAQQTTQYPMMEQMVDPCPMFVEQGSTCCQGKGRCMLGNGPCFDPTRIKAEVDNAVGALTYAFDEFFTPLGIIDIHLQRALERVGLAATQLTKVGLYSLFVSPFADKASPNAYGQVLANVGCATQDVGWAVGHAIAVPFSLTGHILTLITSLSTSLASDLDPYSEGFNNLSAAIGQGIFSISAVSADLAAFEMGALGAILEGDFSSRRWATVTGTTTCAIEESIQNLRISMRTLFSALDVSGKDRMCEAGTLADSIVELSTAFVIQILRAIGHGADGTLPKMSVTEPFVAYERMCIAIGNAVSAILYRFTALIDQPTADSLKALYDGIGAIIATTLNLFPAMLQSFIQLILLIIPGIDSYVDGAVGINAYTPMETLAISWKAFFIAWGQALDTVSTTAASVCNNIAVLVDDVFISKESKLVQLVNAFLNVIITFIDAVVCIPSGSVSCAWSTFTNAVATLISVWYNGIVRLLLELIDSVIFPGVTINGEGPLECLSFFITCITHGFACWLCNTDTTGFLCTILGNPDCSKRDLGLSADPLQAISVLQVTAIMFPEYDSCRSTLLFSANTLQNAYYNYSATNSSASSANYNSAIGLVMRYKSTLCLIRFMQEGVVWPYVSAPTSKEAKDIARQSTAGAISTRDGLTEELIGMAGELDDQQCADLTTESDPITVAFCKFAPAARITIVATSLVSAMSTAVVNGTTDGISALTSGMASVGLDQDTINHYVAIFNATAKTSSNAVDDLLTNVLHLSLKDPGVVKAMSLIHSISTNVSALLGNIDNATQMAMLGRTWGKFAKDTAIPRDYVNICSNYWCGHNISALAQPQGSYAIGEKLDCIGPTNCTDTARYTDEYGCEVSYPGDTTPIPPPGPPPDYCPPWCPNCLSGQHTLNLTRLCPIARTCPSASFPDLAYVQGACDRICHGPSTSDTFLRVCSAYGIDANDLEVWELASLSASVYYNVTVDNLINIFGPDVVYPDAITVRGGDSVDDFCTALGRGDAATVSTFCHNKCDYNNADSYISYAEAAIMSGNSTVITEFYGTVDSPQTVYGLTLAMCSDWCTERADRYCIYNTVPVMCYPSATASMACSSSCDLQWDATIHQYPPGQCVPEYHQECIGSDPSSPTISEYTSCKCPPNPNDHSKTWCTCDYTFSSVGTAEVYGENFVPFFCPYTLKEPVFRGLRNAPDYDVLSDYTRVKINRTVSGVLPSKIVPASSILSLESVQYSPPTLSSPSCTNQLDYIPLSSGELASYGLSTASLSDIPSLPGWVYVGNNMWTSTYNAPTDPLVVCSDTPILGVTTVHANTTANIVGTTVCARWQITDNSTNCPQTPLNTGTTGACALDNGACSPSATYVSPTPPSTCDPSLHCATGLFDPVDCTSSSQVAMSATVCGTVPSGLTFDINQYDWTTNYVYRNYVWLYIRPPTVFVPVGTPVGMLVSGDLSQTVYPSCSSTTMDCTSVNVPPVIPSGLTGPSITIENFLLTYGINGSANFDEVSMTRAQAIEETEILFSSTTPTTSVVTYQSRNDFCSSLCPNDTWCQNLLPVNCTYYRTEYGSMFNPPVCTTITTINNYTVLVNSTNSSNNYITVTNTTNTTHCTIPTIVHGHAAAITWMCSVLYNIDILTSYMFPLVTTSLTNNFTDGTTPGAVTYTPALYQSLACTSHDGNFFNNLQYDPSSLYPTTHDRCAFLAPFADNTDQLSSTQCGYISQYAIRLKVAFDDVKHVVYPISIIRDDEGGEVEYREPPLPRNEFAWTARYEESNRRYKKNIPPQCTLMNCSLNRLRPTLSSRLNPPQRKPSVPLPVRDVCYYDPVMPCVRCGRFKWLPQNATEFYLWLSANGAFGYFGSQSSNTNESSSSSSGANSTLRRALRDFPFIANDDNNRELINLIDKLDFLVHQVIEYGQRKDKNKPKTTNDESSSSSSSPPTPQEKTRASLSKIFSPDVLAYIARELEAATCVAFPDGGSCHRLEDLVDQHGADTKTIKQRARQYPLRKTRNEETPPPVGPTRTIKEALARGFWIQVIPNLKDVHRDCFLLCGYNYTELLESACTWRAFDRYGVVGTIWDYILLGQSTVCNLISPGNNGSEWYMYGGPFEGLNASLIDMELQHTAAGEWLESSVFLQQIEHISLSVVGSILGVTPQNLTVSELATAVIASILKKNSTEVTTQDIKNFILNYNLDGAKGSVGLLYYLLIPTPFGVDCPKIYGEVKLFGVIPIWNPLWRGAPVWVPYYISNATHWMSGLEMLAPRELILNNGGCNALRDINIPFTHECGCNAPRFENCGVTHGFSDPLDTLFFFINWVFPGVAQSIWIRGPLSLLGLSGKFGKFANVASRPDFDSYLYCFLLTLPGVVWVIFAADLLMSLVAWGLGIIFQLVGLALSLFAALLFAALTWVISPIMYGGGGYLDEDEEGDMDENID